VPWPGVWRSPPVEPCPLAGVLAYGIGNDHNASELLEGEANVNKFILGFAMAMVSALCFAQAESSGGAAVGGGAAAATTTTVVTTNALLITAGVVVAGSVAAGASADSTSNH